MNVKNMPAMGIMTDSEMFLTREKTPGEKLAGVPPTCVATSATCLLTASNIPDKLFIMPSTSILLSHSAICSNSAPKGWHFLYRLTEKTGKKRHQL